MISEEIEIVNPLGLHARAAAKLVKIAAKFPCRIMVLRNEPTASANARSILSLLCLCAKQGMKVEIVCDGKDENDALAAVTDLFKRGFGEI